MHNIGQIHSLGLQLIATGIISLKIMDKNKIGPAKLWMDGIIVVHSTSCGSVARLQCVHYMTYMVHDK